MAGLWMSVVRDRFGVEPVALAVRGVDEEEE